MFTLSVVIFFREQREQLVGPNLGININLKQHFADIMAANLQSSTLGSLVTIKNLTPPEASEQRKERDHKTGNRWPHRTLDTEHTSLQSFHYNPIDRKITGGCVWKTTILDGSDVLLLGCDWPPEEDGIRWITEHLGAVEWNLLYGKWPRRKLN